MELNAVAQETKIKSEAAGLKDQVWPYFVLLALGLIVVAVSEAGLAWDGSYIAYKVFDTQAPVVVHDRFQVVPLQLLVLFFQLFISNVTILKVIFSLVYAIVPLLALALSWWIVRERARSLFIWPVLGIGFGTLPAQICLVNDEVMALQLFWPVLLAVLVGMPKSRFGVVVIGILLAAVLVAHPISIALFGLGAAFALAISYYRREQRSSMWKWAGVFVGLGLLGGLRLLLFRNSYEDSQISVDILKEHFEVAVLGLPLVAILLVWLGALLVFVAPILKEKDEKRDWSFLYGLELLCFIAAGALLLLWAKDPVLWERGLDFRTWAPLASLPFLVMALLESLRRKSERVNYVRKEWTYRTTSMLVITIVFSIVLCVQSLSWVNLSSRLQEAVNQSTSSCIPVSSLPFLGKTPLGHWSLTSYSLMLGERQPQKVVLFGNACTDKKFSDALPLTNWGDNRPWQKGWFDLTSLKQRLS